MPFSRFIFYLYISIIEILVNPYDIKFEYNVCSGFGILSRYTETQSEANFFLALLRCYRVRVVVFLTSAQQRNKPSLLCSRQFLSLREIHNTDGLDWDQGEAASITFKYQECVNSNTWICQIITFTTFKGGTLGSLIGILRLCQDFSDSSGAEEMFLIACFKQISAHLDYCSSRTGRALMVSSPS